MRGDLPVSGSGSERPRVAIWQAVLQFFGVAIGGTFLTAVAALFAYANTPNPDAHDSRFLTIVLIGAAVSVVAGALVAMHAIRSDSATVTGNGAEYSLLQKYRRADKRVGADNQAGQYRIGERYLRDLLGRRGA
jgi:phosphotransferase system  glucose/maltose/N-acetylglucosamine-specific IIC component